MATPLRIIRNLTCDYAPRLSLTRMDAHGDPQVFVHGLKISDSPVQSVNGRKVFLGRNGETFPCTGILRSAARLDNGTTADVLVLYQGEGHVDQAFSGAIVREIRSAR